jgi:peptide/nickel transport system ATP-binding protein
MIAPTHGRWPAAPLLGGGEVTERATETRLADKRAQAASAHAGPHPSAEHRGRVEHAYAPLLAVRDLHVQFASRDSLVHAVRGIGYDVYAGEIVALVGESGCGKSVSSLAVMRLLDGNAATTRFTGRALLSGRDCFTLPEEAMRRVRGREMAMIFQEPMTSLNPLMTIGRQIVEPMIEHLDIARGEAEARAVDLLRKVGVPDPDRRMQQYPHEFSGGMRQRAMIAMALSCNPRIIIADEPTTALDVTIQAQILDLLRSLVDETGVGLVLITHNLGLVARYADRVNVMYAGRIVEAGSTAQVLRRPRHRYTVGLLGAVPRLDRPRTRDLRTVPGQPPSLSDLAGGCAFRPRCAAATAACDATPALTEEGGRRYACFHPNTEAAVDGDAGADRAALPTPTTDVPPALAVRNLTKAFDLGRGVLVKAVQGIAFDVPEGGTLGLVGESGCGKTTVARTLLRLETATAGAADYKGRDILRMGRKELFAMRRDIQVVYQDPFTSLNPRHRIGRALTEPLLVHGICKSQTEAAARVAELLELVGLAPAMADRYPHQMSGGQRQRVGIARALGMNPKFVILDEPVSALDVSIQAQIMNLLADLQRRLGLSYLFIAHDLAVVRHISDRVAVMYLGRIVETGSSDELFSTPRHPYTRALLSAVPSILDTPRDAGSRETVSGELPSPINPPSGCVFHPRCPIATAACKTTLPPVVPFSSTHRVACLNV